MNPASVSSLRRPWLVWAFVAAVLFLHFALANAAAWNKCGMFDEPSHLGGGYSFWRTDDYRMLPLAIAQQRWMTLPFNIRQARAPDADTPTWRRADNWGYGRQLLYDVGNDGMSLLRDARMMTSLLSVALGLLVFVWSQRLFGTAGGIASLLLYAANPSVLAHAAAATNDMSAALAFTAAAWSLSWTLEKVTVGRLATSSVVWGLAMAAKFSAVLLLPVAALLTAVRFFDARPIEVRVSRAAESATSGLGRLGCLALVAVAHAVGAWFVVWALFGFQFAMFTDLADGEPQPYLGTFEQLIAHTGGLEPWIRAAHQYRLLPEGYLYCFAETIRTTAARVTFLDGWYGIYGFKTFFPKAFLYKTPAAFFVLALFAGGAHLALRLHQLKVERRKPGPLLREGFLATAPLWCVLGVYGLSSVSQPINLGIRHILPMFAPLFILCGVVGHWFHRLNATSADRLEFTPRPLLRFSQASTIVLIAIYAGATAAAYPNYLAYFNLPSGGIDRGHEHLVDSSLDWGQELPALRDWLDDQGVLTGVNRPRIYLSYFGTTPPSSVGLNVTPLACYFNIKQLDPRLEQKFEPRPAPGLYCYSATMLQSLYLSPFGGPWRQAYEKRYREMLPHIKALEQTANDRAARDALVAQQPSAWWEQMLDEFELARTARLAAYLRTQRPLEVINGAMLVFKLSDADLTLALEAEIPTRPDPATIGEPIAY
ncbi:MAG: glycosyltransferase family 39 protein [Planctomycetaceae bacterium]|nr:glycosyltransferase family 39 protein [Planctomycetaceae bacterium]